MNSLATALGVYKLLSGVDWTNFVNAAEEMGVRPRRLLYPYTSIFIDATPRDFLHAARLCTLGASTPAQSTHTLTTVFTSPLNPNPVLPCLSVRSGLDLYLAARCFPPGSEVIMSAVNIPAMTQVIRAHGLRIVSLDINIETMAPRLDLLPRLVTPQSRLLLLANIYGRGYDLQPYLDTAARLGLEVVEDLAEGFSGLDYLGHPRAHLSLFSFGPIKYLTAFGGCLAKVRCPVVHAEMSRIQGAYPVQSTREYLTKVVKYAFVYACINRPAINWVIVTLMRGLRIDYKKLTVRLLRGFPADRLLPALRQRPCAALLTLLTQRLGGRETSAHVSCTNERAEYVSARLPAGVGRVGAGAGVRNHWLFPVLVESPEEAILALDAVGVDGYRGTTQLDCVESDPPLSPLLHPPNVSKVPAPPDEAPYMKGTQISKSASNASHPVNLFNDFQSAIRPFTSDLTCFRFNQPISSCLALTHNGDDSSGISGAALVGDSSYDTVFGVPIGHIQYDPIANSLGGPESSLGATVDTESPAGSSGVEGTLSVGPHHSGGPYKDNLSVRAHYSGGPHEVALPYRSGGLGQCRAPSEARYLIDHVVYLPVHRNVPMDVLAPMCDAMVLALSRCTPLRGALAGARGPPLPRSKL